MRAGHVLVPRPYAKIGLATSAAVVAILFLVSNPLGLGGIGSLTREGGVILVTSHPAKNNSTGFVSYQSFAHIPATVPSALGSWPTYEYAMNRSGHSATELTLSARNASQLALEWNVTLPGPVYSSPIVINGTVYVGCWDGKEYALSAINGSQLWNVSLGVENFSGKSYGASWLSPLGISSSAAVYNGVLYVGAFTDYVAVSTTTHLIIWNTSVGTVTPGHTNLLNSGYYSWSSPTLFGGDVYVGLSSQIDNPFPYGGIWELSATTGAVVNKWWSGASNNVPTEGASVWSTPTIDAANNTLWVTTGNAANPPQNSPYSESIIALNATSLTLEGAWTVPSPGNLDSDFGAGVTLFSNGTTGSAKHYVVATNKNGWAYALNGTNLNHGLSWKNQDSVYPGQTTCTNFQAPGASISPGAYDGHSLYLGSVFTTNAGVAVNGSIRSVNPSTGTVNWETTTPGGVSGGLAAADGLVVTASRWFHVVGPDSNHCYRFWGTNESWLQVLNATNGNELYRYYFGFPVVSAPTIADGRIFVTAAINNTNNWNTERIHLGHVYAFGLGLAAPTQVRPVVNATCAGVLAFGNATGGMPSYGGLGWVWGDGTGSSGHGGLHCYTFSPNHHVTLSVSFSLVDATNTTAGALWKVYYAVTACGPGGTAVCYIVIANQCHFFSIYPCYSGPIPITWYTSGVIGIGGVISTWGWTFGDGIGGSNLQSPTYQYVSHGSYLVSVTMTDNERNPYLISEQISA